ncbi:OsmC family protein [Facklamia sp. P12937]
MKFFTDKDFIKVDYDLSFDLEDNHKTAVNYLLTSILSNVLITLIQRAKISKIELFDVEGKINAQLNNPLTLLGVHGYNKAPFIKECQIIIYIGSEMEQEDLIAFCHSALKYCVVYNSLKDAIKFKLNFVAIF